MTKDNALGSPSIDVVIPTIGREALRRAVESVSRQTIKCRPIVVLDRLDAKGDVQELLSAYDHILLTTGGDEGAPTARNLGSSFSQSDFVAFLDDDDWWVPNKIERQLCAIANASDRIFCATAMGFHRSPAVVKVPTCAPLADMSAASYLVQRPKLKYGTNAIQTSSLLVSRTLVDEISWDTSLKKHQDWDYIIRLLQTPGIQFYWTDEVLVHVAQGSLGSISKTPRWQASAQFLEKHRNQMSDRAIADFAWTQILRSSIAALDFEGVKHAIRAHGLRTPHLAATVVGLSGILNAARTIRRAPLS